MTDSPKPTPDTKSWLDKLSHALLREPQDREQLVSLLREAQSRQLLDADALSMIEGVLQVSEMQVRDIMIPRSQMVVVEEQQSLDDFLPTLIESAHSRIPVIGENKDEVIGVLHAKDLLPYLAQNSQHFEIRDVIRPIIAVPESKRLDSLLKEFRRIRNHMAIVIDEYGGVSGLVTIEDIIEQIVGDIEDEFDVDEDTFIKQHSETDYIVKALTSIDEFNAHFDAQLEAKSADTIGGLLMQYCGHIPQRGEKINISPFTFKVLHADNRRIHLLQVLVEKC